MIDKNNAPYESPRPKSCRMIQPLLVPNKMTSFPAAIQVITPRPLAAYLSRRSTVNTCLPESIFKFNSRNLIRNSVQHPNTPQPTWRSRKLARVRVPEHQSLCPDRSSVYLDPLPDWIGASLFQDFNPGRRRQSHASHSATSAMLSWFFFCSSNWFFFHSENSSMIFNPHLSYNRGAFL